MMKKRIPINTKDSIYFIVPDEVMYCESKGSVTMLFLKDGECIEITKGINDLEKLLEGNDFICPHQSYLVNRNYIQLVDFSNDYTLVLTNHIKIPTTIQYRKKLMEIIGSGIKPESTKPPKTLFIQ